MTGMWVWLAFAAASLDSCRLVVIASSGATPRALALASSAVKVIAIAPLAGWLPWPEIPAFYAVAVGNGVLAAIGMVIQAAIAQRHGAYLTSLSGPLKILALWLVWPLCSGAAWTAYADDPVRVGLTALALTVAVAGSLWIGRAPVTREALAASGMLAIWWALGDSLVAGIRDYGGLEIVPCQLLLSSGTSVALLVVTRPVAVAELRRCLGAVAPATLLGLLMSGAHVAALSNSPHPVWAAVIGLTGTPLLWGWHRATGRHATAPVAGMALSGAAAFILIIAL